MNNNYLGIGKERNKNESFLLTENIVPLLQLKVSFISHCLFFSDAILISL